MEKPTWRSLGSCKTCQKKGKTLKISKKIHVGKGQTGRKRFNLCEIIAHNSQSGGNWPSNWYVHQLTAPDVCTVGKYGIIKGLDSLRILLSSPP